MRLFYSLSKSILLLSLLSLLTSCATDSSRDPRAPRKYYIPENETIHKAEIYYADKTADFIVTENAIYVMYSRNYAYLNPAFSCHFDSFPHDPVLEEDWIKVDCSKGGGSQWIGKWFQFTDKSNAEV